MMQRPISHAGMRSCPSLTSLNTFQMWASGQTAEGRCEKQMESALALSRPAYHSLCVHQGYSARLFSSRFPCAENCWSIEVDMMILGPLFHIKVTVGGERGSMVFCVDLPLTNTGLFCFCVYVGRLNFPFAEREKFPRPTVKRIVKAH